MFFVQKTNGKRVIILIPSVELMVSGLDHYAVDHPVMQFVANQLSLMNRGMSQKDAFQKV